ncbi:MAG: hypothetical protein LUD22_00810 [Coprobacillus sp.]|nr:hypothetical protein [Coprobacillus sp.]
MKKLKSKVLCLVSALSLLAGCNSGSTYYFPMDRVEEGAFLTISLDELYDRAITNAETLVVLFTQPSCASCTEAKEQVNAYCEMESVIMYNCEIVDAADAEYANKIVTTADKAFPLYEEDEEGNAELMLPVCYFFMETYVVFTVSLDFVDFFTTHITFND